MDEDALRFRFSLGTLFLAIMLIAGGLANLLHLSSYRACYRYQFWLVAPLVVASFSLLGAGLFAFWGRIKLGIVLGAAIGVVFGWGVVRLCFHF